MGETRIPKRNGEYVIPPEKYLTAIHYCRQYGDWLNEYQSLGGEPRALQYDGSIHGSGTGNPTEQIGIRREELDRKMKLIESAVYEAGPDIYRWLLKGVTTRGIGYEYLDKKMNIPCGEARYYQCRRKAYLLVAERL